MYGYIYKTTNIVNGKIYIGQHVAKKFEPTKYFGSGTLLRAAIKKYSRENFKVDLLEIINTNQKDLDEKEIYYIALYNSTDLNIGYNLDLGGSGGGAPSEIVRKKLSEIWKAKLATKEAKLAFAARFGTGMLGKKQSEKQKEAVRKARLGKKNSEETRQKIKNNRQKAIEAVKMRCSKKIICIELNKIFNSAADANEYFKRSRTATNISNVINTKYTAYGYHWKFYTPIDEE